MAHKSFVKGLGWSSIYESEKAELDSLFILAEIKRASLIVIEINPWVLMVFPRLSFTIIGRVSKWIWSGSLRNFSREVSWIEL